MYLGVGSGGHAEQRARVMLAFEPVLLEQQSVLVLVVGDMNVDLLMEVNDELAIVCS